MQRRGGARGLGAVLFTDIVGSTAVAADLGNARWGELVARHHRLIRRELRRFGGREIDTAGDGFFATFERPVDAIRCAVAAVDAVRELGIEIRAGVSFGELETMGRKPGGLVVNTAARVMSVGGPGEVLVPSAVRDLVPGAGIAFVDHGVHRLKGLDDELRLFLVTGLDGAPLATALEDEEAAARRRAIAPAARGRSRALIAGIAAAAVAAAAIWLLAAGGEEERPPAAALAPRFLVEFDPETGGQRQTIDFVDAGRPEEAPISYDLVAGEGAVWAQEPPNFGTAVHHVDPEDGEIERVPLTASSGAFFVSLVTAFDALWATTDQLIRVNPATDEARSVLAIPPPISLGGATIAADRRNLWLATPTGLVLKLDRNGQEVDRRDVGGGIQLLTVGEGWIWVVDQTAGIVGRIDPETIASVAPPITLTGNIDAIGVLDGYVWTLDFTTGLLSRISIASDRVTAQETLPADPTALATGAGAVWVSHEDGTVTRIDPSPTTQTKFATVDGSAVAIAVDEARESIWVDVIRRD
ncbi:MAG TPA: adenylate/guanylate cyclase domain-containing protein [Actinomycetota bacterium]|nr:adenylate/guanylate cyclase domain-containing protein [Actinomycetota bacterium]